MKTKNLLASVALFSELYNNDNYEGIQDIIAEYIKAVIFIKNKYQLTSLEITKLFEEVFEFYIPESVIRTVLKHKLKAEAVKRDGLYYFSEINDQGSIHLRNEYEQMLSKQNKWLETLIEFIQQKEKHSLTEDDKKELLDNLYKYLLGNSVTDKYSNHISTFIVSNEHQSDFIDNLNSMKEGLILYQGMRYTSNINELGKWNSELTIFLNTELLFSALGYNGLLFEEIFCDFLKLVKEINSGKINQKNQPIIKLGYFGETKNEIETFFLKAENIKQGKSYLDPTKTAMKKIIDEANSLSDIVSLKVKFFLDLKTMGITEYDCNIPINEMKKYNCQDKDIIDKIKMESLKSNKEFNEDECNHYLIIFTKINSLREGKSKTKFEEIKYILISENHFVTYLAHNNSVKFGDDDIPFAKNIDFIISRFWFKLKKGFGNKETLPKSFDVITKAKIFLSSKINNSISTHYEKLNKEYYDGELSEQEAQQRHFALREKFRKPEDISNENIVQSLSFIDNEDYWDIHQREKEAEKNKLVDLETKNKQLEDIIKKRDEEDRKEVEKKKKQENKEKQEIEFSAYWKVIKKNKNMKLLKFFFSIFLNTIVIIFGIGFAIVKKDELLDKYLPNFIVALIVYILVIIIERYFNILNLNSENIKENIEWLKIAFSKKRKIESKKSQRKTFDEESSKKIN